MTSDKDPSYPIKHLQLKLASKVLDVCKRHELKIWAEAGTLLGAVRHHGFIPWDDDIDLMMLREDYDKLLAVADSEFKYPYFLQTAYSDPGYMRGHAQLRLSNTSAIRPSDIWQPFNQGVFIDIFVFDYMPDNQDKLQADIKELNRLRELMDIRNYGPVLKSLSAWKNFFKAKRYFHNHSYIDTFKQFERIFACNPRIEDGYINCPTFTTDVFKKMNRKADWYNETVMLPFEDIFLPAPAAWHEVLTIQYGKDYMTPVKSPTMHGEVFFDLERPYAEALAEMRSNTDWKTKLRKLLIGKPAIK